MNEQRPGRGPQNPLDDFEIYRATHRDYLVTTPREQIARDLLSGLRQSRVGAIGMVGENSVAGNIQGALAQISEDQKVKVREAVGHAVREWNSEEHGTETLQRLASVAAATRAFQAALPLVRTIEENRITREDNNTLQVHETKGSVVAAVSGFAKDPEVFGILERWFFDEGFDSRLKALIHNGLAQARPDDYHKYLPAFLKVAREQPEQFSLEYVLNFFAGRIGAEKLAQGLARLSPNDARQLTRYLAPTIVQIDAKGMALVDPDTKESYKVTPDTPEQAAAFKRILQTAEARQKRQQRSRR